MLTKASPSDSKKMSCQSTLTCNFITPIKRNDTYIANNDMLTFENILAKTNVQGDFSVISSEFVNFIFMVITCRLIKKTHEAKLLDKMSYGDIMDDLSSAWRTDDSPDEPETCDGFWVNTLNRNSTKWKS